MSIFIKDLYVFVHFWTLKNHVLANYSAPNNPISIPIEVLDSWLQCSYDNVKFIHPLSIFIEDLYVFVHFWT